MPLARCPPDLVHLLRMTPERSIGIELSTDCSTSIVEGGDRTLIVIRHISGSVVHTNVHHDGVLHAAVTSLSTDRRDSNPHVIQHLMH